MSRDYEYVCLSHLEDDFLISWAKEWLDDDDTAFACSFCGEEPAVPIDELAEIASSAVNRLYSTAADACVPWDEGEYVFPTMDTAEVIQDLGGFDSWELEDAIAGCIGDEAWVQKNDPQRTRRRRLSDAWESFAGHVAHVSRYLLAPPKIADQWEPDPDIDPTELLPLITRMIRSSELLDTVPESTTFYRARTFDEIASSIRKHQMVSPPPELASQGRMNGAGISVLYGAFDEQTAAAEVFDGKKYSVVVDLRATRPLDVVDLTRAEWPSPYDDSLSLRDFDNRAFLAMFALLITRRVIRDDRVHYEYAPTQMVTEYLRWNLLPAPAEIDGIIYKSAQGEGRNIAVFAKPAECLADSELPEGFERPIGDRQFIEVVGDGVRVFEYEAPRSTPSQRSVRWS